MQQNMLHNLFFKSTKTLSTALEKCVPYKNKQFKTKGNQIYIS